MDTVMLFNRLRRENERKTAISPIIATLLLILIAIAAGVVVYAYVIGFVQNSTSNPGGNTSVIQVQSACISVASHCNGGAYYIKIGDLGSTTLGSGGVAQVYFQDITNPATSTVACPLTSSLSPGSTLVIPTGCTGSTGSLPTVTAGDTVTIKVVAADGGSATYTVKVIS